jgi:hypothetical protein
MVIDLLEAMTLSEVVLAFTYSTSLTPFFCCLAFRYCKLLVHLANELSWDIASTGDLDAVLFRLNVAGCRCGL